MFQTTITVTAETMKALQIKILYMCPGVVSSVAQGFFAGP